MPFCMAYRTVTGKIGDIVQDETLGQINVVFELLDKFGSFDATTQYPGQKTTVTTGLDGSFSVNLWITQKGLRYSKYRCEYLKAWFEFELPEGDGSPIGLSALRQLGTTEPPKYKPEVWERIPIETLGQTSFTLQNAPTEPQNARVYVNGNKQIYGVDYVIDSVFLNWIGAFVLSLNDYMEIYYK